MGRRKLEKRHTKRYRLVGGVLRESFKKEVIEDPKHIDAKLLDQLLKLGVRTFGPGMTEEEVREHVVKNDVLFVLYDSNMVAIAFAGLTRAKDNKTGTMLNGAYLSGAVVAAEAQGFGLYKELAKLRIRYSIEKFGLKSGAEITTRTQNPRIEEGINAALKYGISTIECSVLLSSMSREYRRALFGRMLTKEVPRSNSDRINRAYSELNYASGDAYLLTFTITLDYPQVFEGRF
ncbi:MAG: hypothetical protein ACHQX1_02565 [Candidatus Micrarchaeales archaeon]